MTTHPAVTADRAALREAFREDVETHFALLDEGEHPGVHQIVGLLTAAMAATPAPEADASVTTADVLRELRAEVEAMPMVRLRGGVPLIPEAAVLRAIDARLAAQPEWSEPQRVRMLSANCKAGDHRDCTSMVEQDAPGLGLTDCLCQCHAEAAAKPEPSAALDVERLARAIHSDRTGEFGNEWCHCREVAARYARAYEEATDGR